MIKNYCMGHFIPNQQIKICIPSDFFENCWVRRETTLQNLAYFDYSLEKWPVNFWSNNLHLVIQAAITLYVFTA